MIPTVTLHYQEAFITCKMEYNYDTISKTSNYATHNNSEAIAEAVSYCKDDNKLCEAIKRLVEKNGEVIYNASNNTKRVIRKNYILE